MQTDMQAKAQRYQAALDAFVARVQDDDHILAVIHVGTISPELMWCRDGIQVWLIETDGVSLRRKSDGEEPRIFRTFAEDDVNIWAEIIPRAKFKLMIEGQSRTAFTHNHFAVRRLVHTTDPSIETWFDAANKVATKDQRNELFAMTTWLIHNARHAQRLLALRDDVPRAARQVLSCGWVLAAMAIVEAGEICEDEVVDRGRQLNPELIAAVYDVLHDCAPQESLVRAALQRVEDELASQAPTRLAAVVDYIGKAQKLVGLSELADVWAYTRLYPWNLESACEWLVEHGLLDKLSLPTRVTKKSSSRLEEPAYQLP